MQKSQWNLTAAQWDFLAVMQLVGRSVSIDVIGELAPLKTAALLDLLEKALRAGLMRKAGKDRFMLVEPLPLAVAHKLEAIHTPARISAVLDRMLAPELSRKIPARVIDRLRRITGREYETALEERELAQAAMQDGRPEIAITRVERLLAHTRQFKTQPEYDTLFVAAALDLSNLRGRLGADIKAVPALLKEAQGIAERLGDRRSLALIALHRGRLYYFSDALADAVAALADGLKTVEELGDADIDARSAEFRGLYYFLQGHYAQAVEEYDLALRTAAAAGDRYIQDFIPIHLGYALSVLGQYHRAVGVMDCHLHRMQAKSEHAFANLCQANLGLILLMMNKRKEAAGHLYQAFEEARAHDNMLVQCITQVILAYFHSLEDRLEMAYTLCLQTAQKMAAAGFSITYYPYACILEMLSVFARHGCADLPGYSFPGELDKILNGPNVHLRGVALRLRAEEDLAQGLDPAAIAADLERSAGYLELSGDPIQLARTWAEIARLKLTAHDPEQARAWAVRIWNALPEPRELFFPDDLRPLLEDAPAMSSYRRAIEDIFERLFRTMLRFVAPANLNALMEQLFFDTELMFRAEHAGIFMARDGFKLRLALNLTPEDLQAAHFREKMALITRAFQENTIILAGAEDLPGHHQEKNLTVLCIPFESEGRVAGVLYYDSVYLENSFHFLDKPALMRLARNVSYLLERMMACVREARQSQAPAEGVPAALAEAPNDGTMITHNPATLKLLAQAELVAATDAAVLVLGETGVGKELVARRIHATSHRRSGPFVVVDIASLPEGLIESELFGHEKGAFTGADRQKKGRMELAHQGTLFIDELGEIPKSTQVKLLRVLQDRTFMRVGGTRNLTADFRLIAATNRDLLSEISQGHFRQDLFYRLNVVTLHIPPLRERPEDVIPLARHYLDLFAKRYNRPSIRLSARDEGTLGAYPWPGNIRELRNVMERAVLLSTAGQTELTLPKIMPDAPSSDLIEDLPDMDELQKRYIRHVLRLAQGKISGPSGAAERLGMKRSTLMARMRKLGLSPETAGSQ